MLGRCKLFGLFGTTAIVAGIFLFLQGGNNFSPNWVRWVFGTLLWFVGCALLICWALVASLDAGERAENGKDQLEREKSRVVKKAS
jgi:hypothetical protein